MAVQEQAKSFSPFIMMEYMINPFKKALQDTKMLSVSQLKEDVATIEALSQMITSFDSSSTISIKEQDKAILSTVKDVCFPLFYSLHMLPDSGKMRSERRRTFSSIIHCIIVALNHLDDEALVCKIVLQTLTPLGIAKNKVEQFLLKLKDSEFHKYQTELDVLTLLEFFQISFTNSVVMEKVFSNLICYETNKHEFLDNLFQALLTTCETKSFFSKAMSAIVKLLPFCAKTLREKVLNEIWQRFTQPLLDCADGKVDEDSLWMSLYALYSLRDWFFPLDNQEESKLVFALHLQDKFWLLVQAGLLSSEPSYRKMSMYMLKRLVDTCQQNDCVINFSNRDCFADNKDVKITDDERNHCIFWWHPKQSSNLSAIWEDYIVLLEVLEEKQVHVIKPLLPRVQSVISACSTKYLDESKKVPAAMHSSWLVTMLSRCFHHESHFLSRWGAVTLLTIDMKEIPFVQQGQLKFLSSDLIKYLQENRLYFRYESTQQGRCSPVRDAVINFFANMFASLNHNEKVEYLTNVLQIVCANTWGSIPLVFLFQGLSRIPPQPIISSDIMDLVRYILQASLTTLEVATRGAIQCFIAQTMMNLLDPEQVSPSQFFMAVAGMTKEESFQRGTALWNRMVQWLDSDAIQQSWTKQRILADALGFLKQEDWKDTDTSVVYEGYKVLSVSRMVLLFADQTATLRTATTEDDVAAASKEIKKSCLASVLTETSQLMANIGSRAYVNTKLVDASLALLNCVVKELGDLSRCPSDDKVRDLVMLSISANFESIVSYVINRLSQDLTKAEDLDEIRFYADVISTLGSLCNIIQVPLQNLLKLVGNVFTANLKTKNDCQIDSKLEVFTLSAVTIFNSALQILLNSDCAEIQESFFHRISQLPSIHDICVPFSNRKSGSLISTLQIGRVISHFVSNLWQCKRCMFAIQSKLGRPAAGLSSLLEDAMDALAIGSGDSDIAVIQTVQIVLQQIVDQGFASDIPQFLRLAWSSLMEEKKNILFWQRLEIMVDLVIHPTLLKQDKTSEIAAYIEEFLDKVLEMAEAKAGVTYLLMARLTRVMAEHDQDRAIASWLVHKLIDAAIFGAIYEKGKRLMLDIFAYIDSLGEELATNQITSSASKNDMTTRIILISWLSTLKPSVAADHEFVMVFLRSLKEKYLHLANLTTYKQFSNSYPHRLKHRMLMVFVLLSDFIQEDACKEFLDDLLQGLILECHPSVRQSLEWLIMRLLLRYPAYVSSVWGIFSQFNEKRSMSLCSLFMIVTHLGPKLPEKIQYQFYSDAFSRALSWSLAHHYNTRIFAQACLMRLWQQCKDLKLTRLLETFHVVQSTADFIFENGNSSGTVIKLLDNFMFSYFEPERDFSAETIFYTLPRLACIVDDEWIHPDQFLAQDPVWKSGKDRLIPLMNSSSDLAKCEEGPWRMKAQNVNEHDIVETTDGDFQKKIVSWRQMSPDQETETELITQRRRLKNGGLVFVTSLIEKVPNLGGLCRTSEIFGVSEFVVGNLTHMNDPMFQNLSVSAQKWLNITEVPRHRVIDYMEEKKAQGYVLVGVEQTANSVPLDQYKFSKNTLLLLGNEKEGIPQDMLQNLDVCVEIPQQGIIRSLNVHVCGALIVWEYTRQFLSED